MRNKTNIVIGVLVFVLVMTSPIWLNFGQSKAADGVEVSLDTPAINAMAEKKCIYDTDYMRENHMELLHQWKVQVVRDGNRTMVTPDGREFEMSLQNTCLQCHSNYDEFCKKCHDYNGVEPNCWQCHTNPDTEIEDGAAENGGAN
jgi:hypothetical protein